MMSRLFRRIGAAAAVGITLLTCTGCPFMLPGNFISGFVLHPDISCEETAAQLDLGSLIQAATPQEVGLTFQPFTVTSANGARLTGWFIPAQQDGTLDANPLGTVLVCHGTDGSIACALPWGGFAAQNRYHAVLFDYQGFGDSEGAASLATLLDDSDAVLQWIVGDSAPARQEVHLLGVSLGTSAAFGLAALRDRPQIQSVIVDGAFDPEQQVEAIAGEVDFFFPTAEDSTRSAFPWLFDMRDNLGNVRVPVMFITAELDGITPASGAMAMKDLLPTEPVNSWLFKGMTHVQPLFKLTANYVSLALTFWANPNTVADPDAYLTDPSIQVPVLFQ